MTTREGFLHSINTNPQDPHVHAVYADWLEDQGDLQEAVEHRRKVFEKQLLLTPKDYDLRRTFADWLDQHDDPIQADRQRRYESADKWMDEHVAQCGEHCTNYSEVWREYFEATRNLKRKDPRIRQASERARASEEWVTITREMVMEAGKQCKETGYSFVQGGSDSARDLLGSKEMRLKFWEVWSVLTGEEPPLAEGDWGPPNPFDCSC